MKPARIIILAVAVSAAGLAGFLAMKLAGGQRVVEQAQQIIQKAPSVNVLVASANLPVGSRLNADAIRWMEWPENSVAEGFITDRNRPDALTALNGAVVRIPMFQGEPVRIEKVADSSSRTMSAILPSGKRAVATDITVSTGAGGFILPNDRVDVIMVRKDGEDKYLTETVLSNVRVLAVDQQIKPNEDGSETVVGTTATLELTPDQTKVIAVAQQMAQRLTLALRSVADAQESDTTGADYLLSGGDGMPTIQVIKSGTIVESAGGNKM